MLTVNMNATESLQQQLDLSGVYTFIIRETDKRTGFTNSEFVELEVNKLVQNYVYERSTKPLIAQIYDFSPSGNLTIIFNKPIVLPNLFVHNLTETEPRLLQDEEERS